MLPAIWACIFGAPWSTRYDVWIFDKMRSDVSLQLMMPQALKR
jgi:hypothetical protein